MSNLPDEQVKRDEDVADAGDEALDAPLKSQDPGQARQDEHSSQPGPDEPQT